MSYFDIYFNTDGYLSLREYSNLIDPFKVDKNHNWVFKDLKILDREIEKVSMNKLLPRKFNKKLL